MKRWVIGISLLTVLLVVALVVRLIVQKRELEGPPAGTGIVEGTTVNLSARIAARVVEKRVEKGDTVKAGQLLITLDCDEPAARLTAAEAQLAATRSQAAAADAQAAAATQGSKAAAAAIDASEAQIATLKVQYGAAERQAKRIDALGRYATAATQDKAQTAAAGLAHQVAAARSQEAATREQAQSAEAQATAALANAEAATEGIEAGQASVALAQIGTSECSIYAPRDGVIEEVYYEPGELAMPGATVARLVDLNEVKVIFYLPNAQLAAITQGDRAAIVADAWPGLTFEGRVRTVATTAAFTPRNIQTRSDRDRLVYPVEIRVPNAKHELRPGMPVHVTLEPGAAAAAPTPAQQK